ncbi:hypothetical protein [Thermoactinospora rubra]|uniref:hypothetical protein n=1 Tax=Thermoactinospora rubra TaxID=1088767 RepID=UPI001F0A7646|nr:hypothetical protein [Thermoactinospora rubra]
MRNGWVPPRDRRRAIARTGYQAARALAALTSLVMALMLFDAEILAPFALVMLGLSLLFFGSLVRGDPMSDAERRAEAERRVYEQARANEGRYVLLDRFDEASMRLMRRAQAAVDSVMSSQVNQEGLLDEARNTVILPEQEWEIARLLAKLSGLRTEHRELVAGEITPEVAAVAEPLARALDSSEAAVVARVEALETYAAHVAEAERAYRAQHQIEQLRAKLPRYEELLAESGAQDYIGPEIERLSQDADRLEQALRRSVLSARDAFRYLER